MIHRNIQERGLVGDLFCIDPTISRPTIIMLSGSEGGKTWSDTPESVGARAYSG